MNKPTPRILKEFRTIERNPPEHCYISLRKEDDYRNWIGSIMGPENSPYEGGIFFIDIRISPDYPMEYPKIKFLTQIYHPNINDKGEISIHRDAGANVCLCCGSGWTPALTIQKCYIYIYIYIV